jgi:hypothetical protein
MKVRANIPQKERTVPRGTVPILQSNYGNDQPVKPADAALPDQP